MRLLLLFFACGTCASAAFADCTTPVKSDYEQIYCLVMEKGEGASLPSWEDFSRNNRQVQRLLLKRPAEKLKIALPTVNAALSKPAASTSKPMPSVSVTVVAKNQEPKLQGGLSSCRLGQETIICGDQIYRLQENVSNKHLSPGTFAPDYKMALPVYQGDKNDKTAIQGYLTDAYAHYLNKMLAIGLGASTMSYTRFNQVFFDLLTKNISFAGRFETMYHHLKDDKKTMNVQARLSALMPNSISQCDTVGHQFMVCDLDTVNWVYRVN